MKYLFSLLTLMLLMSCATPNSSKYSKIEYEAGACYGFCPIFKLTINPDRTAVIDAERFTFTEGTSRGESSEVREGIFKTTLKNNDYKILLSKLESLNLKSLNNYYGNKNVSDLPTAYLKVTFADGSVKHIEDYGKGGTEKLDELYSFIEDLRKTQTWIKVAE
ncbi:MAG: DUF6438 domain-containing protein [Kaistella sp.]